MRLWLLFVQPVAGLRYVADATYDPSLYGAWVWPPTKRTTVAGADWYNPSFARLGAPVMKMWNATYIGAFKRNLQRGGCWNLMNNETLDPATRHESLQEMWHLKTHLEPQNYLLLDESYRAIRRIELTGDPELLQIIVTCGDIRFESGKHATRILAHAHCRKTYAFWWIDFFATADKITAIPFEHLDKTAPVLNFRAQNVGVLWDGRPRHSFQILYWLTKHLDVRIGIPPAEEPGVPPDSESLSNGAKGQYNMTLHNSGSPIPLDDWCPGISLALGHSHIDAAAPSYQGSNVSAGATRYGNTYLYNLVLYNNTNYEALRVSPPFCFPTNHLSMGERMQLLGNNSSAKRCDLIQFVTTFARRSHSSTIIHLGYGVNDCESVLQKVHVDNLLDFIDSSLFREGICKDPRLKRYGDQDGSDDEEEEENLADRLPGLDEEQGVGM